MLIALVGQRSQLCDPLRRRNCLKRQAGLAKPFEDRAKGRVKVIVEDMQHAGRCRSSRGIQMRCVAKGRWGGEAGQPRRGGHESAGGGDEFRDGGGGDVDWKPSGMLSISNKFNKKERKKRGMKRQSQTDDKRMRHGMMC